MPVVQRERFAEQAKQGADGDDEAQVPITFVYSHLFALHFTHDI